MDDATFSAIVAVRSSSSRFRVPSLSPECKHARRGWHMCTINPGLHTRDLESWFDDLLLSLITLISRVCAMIVPGYSGHRDRLSSMLGTGRDVLHAVNPRP